MINSIATNSIASLIKQSIKKLSLLSDTPTIDVELLLAKALNRSQTFLYAYPEYELTLFERQMLANLLNRRIQGEPIAYILEQVSFWNLNLKVTQDTLIPRPETELLVELILKKFPAATSLNLADLGTGSGAIALAIAKERPKWNVFATDISAAALDVAQHNATSLQLRNLHFSQGNWCQALPQLKMDVIISNPPYVAENDPCLKKLRFEPTIALVAITDGLQAIHHIIYEANQHLVPGGVLMLEHGNTHAETVATLFKNAGYKDIEVHQDLAGHDRVTIANRS